MRLLLALNDLWATRWHVKIRIITASAGSGKTWRLTKELDDAIASGAARPEGIIATTFTKQAAAELIERARTRLLQGGRTREAHQLLAARIGTVNSVCGSLVADFAFELGMSPELRVLDEATAELEFRRALARVVTSERADDLQAMTSRFATDLDWRHEVRRMVEAARANGLTADQLASCAERSIQDLDACMGAVETIDLDRELAEVLAVAIAAIEANEEDKTKGTATYLEGLRSSVRDLAARRLSWGSWSKLSSDKPTKKSLGDAAAVQAAAARHLAHPRLRSEMHALIRMLFEIAGDGLNAYQDYKREVGVIDFVDQETLALEVLKLPEVREALVGQIDLVLVDEFQDTSPIQLAVFLELAAISKESIWVGDPKQAIYGFRGTDPGLMDAAIESLTSTKTDADLVEQAAKAVTRGQVDTLDISYRSRPELVAITSEIFARAFASQGMPEERTRLRSELEDEPEGLGNVLEYWPFDLEKKNSGTRAQAVAAGVRDLFSRGVNVRGRDGVRSARHSDVAVLCRTNAQCQEVADALGQLGVSAVVPRMALTDTIEAMVLVAALQLWVDADDVLAAAEIARLVTHPENLEAFVTRALAVPGREAFRDDPTVARILAARDSHRDLDPLSVLDVVFDASGLRTLCAGWGDASQRLGNLDALRSHAVAYVDESTARGDAPTLVGLIRRLSDIGDDGWGTSRTDRQALLSDGESVTVSTWHRAKGLEWPVTVLFGLESLREPQSHGVHVMSDRTDFDVDDPLGGRWIRFWPNPYTNQQQKGPVREAFERSSAHAALVARAEREALRVLYVGWTRARDRLVLAAQRGDLLSGIVGKLSKIDASLVYEPAAETRGVEPIEWAGFKSSISAAPSQPAVDVVSLPVPGVISEGLALVRRSVARKSPSSVESVPCRVGEVVTLGDRFTVRGRPNMEAVGHAVHAFLGADRSTIPSGERLAMANALLQRFDVHGCIDASAVVDAADRLNVWLELRFKGARSHHEYPVLQRTEIGTIVVGTADLVLRRNNEVVIVDHKSFPGQPTAALARVHVYAGQLAMYAAVFASAVACAKVSTWVHFPIVGQVIEIVVES